MLIVIPVFLPGLGLSHTVDGRLPKAQAAVQPCHWQGLVPVTDATETKITMHKTSLGTGLKGECWSVIYFLAQLIAKSLISIWGEDSKQRNRTPDTHGIRHKYIHSNSISLGHPISQIDFASFFLSISSSRSRYVACIYGKARRYINQKLLRQHRHNRHAARCITLENPAYPSTVHLRDHLEKTVKDLLKLQNQDKQHHPPEKARRQPSAESTSQSQQKLKQTTRCS